MPRYPPPTTTEGDDMFYRQDEKDRRWKDDRIKFTELAHQYPCCDVPTLKDCVECDINTLDCKNKQEWDDLVKGG